MAMSGRVRIGWHASHVDTSAGDWSSRFPRLFEESYVDYAAARITYFCGVAPQDLVSRLHVVAVTDQAEVVVCRSVQGWRFLPGGTREPGESLFDLARRELLEEAGAALRGELHHFSAHQVDSDRVRPYRSHLPHPRAYWAYAVGRVRITGPPLNPPDGETVVEVLALPAHEAAEYLGEEDPIHADVVRHAHAMGLLHQTA
jgi:8-oxo-dGTP diphosphatase